MDKGELTAIERSELKSLRDSPVPLWGRGEKNVPVIDAGTRSYLDRGLVRIVNEGGRVGFRISPAGSAALEGRSDA